MKIFSLVFLLVAIGTISSFPTGVRNYPFLTLVNHEDVLDSKNNSVAKIECPDHKSTCKDDQTCCEISSNKYGCCSVPNAVCCSDGKHCCPSGYECDETDGKCVKADPIKPDDVAIIPQISLKPMVSKLIDAVTCPDHTTCASNQTCCETATDKYACCPMPFAVCCKDHKHCCPNDYACEDDGTCVDQLSDKVVPMSKKEPSIPFTPPTNICPDGENGCRPVKNTICPDGVNECPDGEYTCCEMSDKKYGCCPFLDAVCCVGNAKCCPTGYKCNGSEGTCVKNQQSWNKHIPFMSVV